MTDSVLAMARAHVAVDNQQLVDFGLKFAGVAATTPHDRIERAVAEEIADLVGRTRAAIQPFGDTGDPSAREAIDALRQSDEFPREALEAIVARLRATDAASPLAAEIDAWTARHRAFGERVKWLLNGTSPVRAATLDPSADADELHHVLTSNFRFEARVLETLAINRIAQAAAIGTFFRSTKEAEANSIVRFFDTYALYANVFEWGLDSVRGRAAIARMNQIHGRYYIPNDEMKFVLLQGACTWLDGADRIGHRRVTDNERRAMLAAWVRMGQAMNIQGLTENYEEMYGWYREVCLANAEFKPYKRKTFDTIVGASLSGQLPTLRSGLFLAAQVAMDDTYRSATGYPEPSKDEKQAVRAIFFTVGALIEQLPYAPYIRSLMNNPVRRGWTDPKELGAPDRSSYMPAAFAALPNAGFPEWQKPLPAPDGADAMDFPEITWDQVRAKAGEGFAWLVVDGYVYDLSVIRDVHPGGATILKRWAGKDASRAYHAARHSNGTDVFSLNYRIGRVVGEAPGAPQQDPAADVAEAIATNAKNASGAAAAVARATKPVRI